MSDVLLERCGARIINVPNTCDGSLTKASIRGVTPGDLVSLGNRGLNEIAFLYKQMTRAKMTGVREHGLYDLVMGTSKKVKLNKMSVGNRSFFLPFMMMEQEDYINASAFVIDSGTVNPNAGATVGGITYPASSWDVVVSNSPSPYASPIKNLSRYFLPEAWLTVLNLSAGGAAQEPYFRVINAVDTDSTHAKITLAPNYTDAGWAGLTAGEKAVYQPAKGVVQIGVNSIMDWESWCHVQPAELSKRIIHFWFETNRYVECWDDETKKYLEYIKTGKVNEYLDRFMTLDMSEYNRRQFATYQRNFLTNFFYGQRINEHQNAETYQDLPKIYDPTTGLLLDYKANALGVKTILRECNRVVDYAGAPLDLNVLEDQLISLRRHREVDGGRVMEIDAMCGMNTAAVIDDVMMGYYKAKNRTDFVQQWEPKRISSGDTTLWDYRTYEFRRARVKLNVIVEPFFDDFSEHFGRAGDGIANRGNQMVILDWNDVGNGVAATASRKSHKPDLETDPDLACVIKANVKHYNLQSTTRTAIVEDPSRHLWLENFSNACPSYEYQLCNPTDITPAP